jgi:Pin2-interacting protein X1
MTIVASEDTRNKDWSKSSIGSKLLKNMGWSEGQGLGRNKQGLITHLRAVRPSGEALGIGASTQEDLTGMNGWNKTTDSFASVLKNLQAQHGPDDATTTKKKKKKVKKELVLARNKVTAGHSKKMRESKDLSTKSEADMAAIFGGIAVFKTAQKSNESRNVEKNWPKKRKLDEKQEVNNVPYSLSHGVQGLSKDESREQTEKKKPRADEETKGMNRETSKEKIKGGEDRNMPKEKKKKKRKREKRS